MKEALKALVDIVITVFVGAWCKTVDTRMNELRAVLVSRHFSGNCHGFIDGKRFLEVLKTPKKGDRDYSRFVGKDEHKALARRPADEIERANPPDDCNEIAGVYLPPQFSDLDDSAEVDVIAGKIVEKIPNGIDAKFFENCRTSRSDPFNVLNRSGKFGGMFGHRAEDKKRDGEWQP